MKQTGDWQEENEEQSQQVHNIRKIFFTFKDEMCATALRR